MKNDEANEESIVALEDVLVGVYVGATDRILSLDFSFLNLRVMGLNSDAFKALVTSIIPTEFKESYQETSHALYRRWNEKYFSATGSYGYAFVPIDWNQVVTEQKFVNLQNYLLLMFPSDFRLYGIVAYSPDEENGKYAETYSIHYDQLALSTIPLSRPLHFQPSDREHIIAFLKMAFNYIPKTVLNVSFNSYFDSFKQRYHNMAYVNLCMCLEALTAARSEMTHQISRLCAVINSETKEEGRVIYRNMYDFYDLRSSIVHGDKTEHLILASYYPALLSLASRTLIEMIYLMIKDKAHLKVLVNESGYGEKLKLREGIVRHTFNQTSQWDISLPVEPIDKFRKRVTREAAQNVR